MREQFVNVVVDICCAISLAQRSQSAHTCIVGSDLRTEVACGLPLGANLRERQSKDVGHDLSTLDHFHRRDDDALLKHLAERADAARRASADIYMMREVGDVAEEGRAAARPYKDRRDERY